jgi:hypothetical protein
MKARLESIRAASTTVELLSSPATDTVLPFPQPFGPLPTDRFRIAADGTFSYMGREQLRGIYLKWKEAFVDRSGLLVINVYGTPGSARGHTWCQRRTLPFALG